MEMILVFILLARSFAKIIILTPENHDEFIESEKATLIKYSTSWCGYCKKIAPEYQSAAEMLLNDNIKLGDVDCEKYSDFCQKKGIEGYPTLKLFINGVEGPYKGGRTAAEISEYMKNASKPNFSTIEQKDVAEFIKKAETVAIGIFPGEDTQEYKNFVSYSDLHRDMIFGVILKPGASKVSVYHKEEEETSTDINTQEKLDAFIQYSRVPYLAEMGPENYMQYLGKEFPLGFLFYSTPEELKIQDDIREAILKYKKRMKFVTIDANKYGNHARTLNLEKKWPAIAIHDQNKDLKYPFKEKITKEGLIKYIEDYMAGKLDPEMKSQKLEQDPNDNVQMLVRENFKQVVLDGNKDVLVMFMTPWCTHCKKMMPEYNKIAELYKPYSDRVVIGRINMEENDIGDMIDFVIEGYPTIKLFRAEKENIVVEYKGRERTAESIALFMADNSAHKIAVDVKSNTKEEL